MASNKNNNNNSSHMRLVNSNDIVGADVYNTLLQNFIRVKKEHKILKNAVKEGKVENEQLSENLYKQAKAKRELEQEKKAAEEEIDRVQYENERLKRRIKSMMKQFKEREKEKKVETAQTSMFGKLIGSGVEVVNEKLVKDIEILQEELKIKIEENECIHMKQWEMQQEHEQSVVNMKKDLKSYRIKIRDLEKQAVSKNKCIFELGEEKERHRKRRLEIEEKFEEIQTHLADREAALKEINQQLKNDLELATRRLKEKVIFDDCKIQSWAILNLPPHNEDLRKKRKRASERALALLGQICNNIDEYSNARGALIRLQLHHPKFLGEQQKINDNNNNHDDTDLLSNKDNIQENIISQLTTYALSWRTLHEKLNEFILGVDHDNGNVGNAIDGMDSMNSNDNNNNNNNSNNNNNNNKILIILKQLQSVITWHENLTQSEIDLIEIDDRSEEMEEYIETLKTLQLAYQDFYKLLKNALFLGNGNDDQNNNIETKNHLLLFESSNIILPRKVISGLAQIVRSLRARATIEAKVLQEERQQPFVPQAVRAACMEVEKNIFQISSISERFVECSRDLWKLYFSNANNSDMQNVQTLILQNSNNNNNNINNKEESKMAMHMQKQAHTRRLNGLRYRTRKYASKLQNVCSKLGESVPQHVARKNAKELIITTKELKELKLHSTKKIDELNARVVMLLDQVDQERRLRQSAEEAMKLAQSNLLREKEERSIVELSMKDTIKRLRVEMHGLKIRANNNGDGNNHNNNNVNNNAANLNTPYAKLRANIQNTIMNSLSESLSEIFVAIDASGEGFVSEDQLKASFERLNVSINNKQLQELSKELKTSDDNLKYGKLLNMLQTDNKHDDDDGGGNGEQDTKDNAEAKENLIENKKQDISNHDDDNTLMSAASSSSLLPLHEKRFGSFEYTMSAIDPEGRVLSSLKITEDEFTREEEIRRHYETKYKQYEGQIAIANSKAKEVYSKYKDSIEKLKQLASERSKHMKLLKTTQSTAKQAREELVATRDAMSNQSQMLTSRVLNLEENLAKTKSKLSYVCAHTMRCGRCHGKNRVSYVLMEGRCQSCGKDVFFEQPPKRNKKGGKRGNGSGGGGSNKERQQ